MSTFDPLRTNEPARDESGELLPHPYYWHPDYAEKRARDAANREFAGVLGEACRRMMAQHDSAADEADWWAELAERRAPTASAWLFSAQIWRREAREQRELAQIYRWFGQMTGDYGPPGVCTCRLPRYCPHVPDGRYW